MILETELSDSMGYMYVYVYIHTYMQMSFVSQRKFI